MALKGKNCCRRALPFNGKKEAAEKVSCPPLEIPIRAGWSDHMPVPKAT